MKRCAICGRSVPSSSTDIEVQRAVCVEYVRAQPGWTVLVERYAAAGVIERSGKDERQ